MERVTILDQPFDPEAELATLRRGDPGIGALVSFVGLMRDLNQDQQVSALFLEHYPGMTETALETILDEAGRRWPLERVRVIHRVGKLTPEQPIVLVAVASRHRGEAFRACEYIIDALKTRAPFWKKERTATGEHWVEARAGDSAAAARWTTREPPP
jgi:molybdopterin synthase catalytic subunit